jgi:cytochrome c oxidase assembly protein subunit 15
MSLDPTPVWLRRFAKIVAVLTLFLIFAGAMVTSTGSGLSVPDWPLSYGMLMPPMIAGIFYEHGHRMFAATVGLLTVILAISLQLFEKKRFVRVLGWSSVGTVITQGVLGGMTVLFLQPHALSIAHAAVSEIYLCINMSIAFFTSRSFREARGVDDARAPVGLTTALVLAVYGQILLGALVRHIGAGLAIPDFPLSFGRIVPPFTSLAIAANFAHRAGAAVVTILIVMVARKIFHGRSAQMRILATGLLAVVVLQIFLGAEVVWNGTRNTTVYHSLGGAEALRQAAITSFHVMTGAATLAGSLLLMLTARARSPRRVEERAGALVASEVAA